MPDHMPTPILLPRTALGGTGAQTATHARVTLTEQPDMAIASLATGPDGLAALDAALGPLPDPTHAMQRNGRMIFWTAPQQWFVTAPYGGAHALADALIAAVDGGGYVTDQTDAWAVIDITGTAPLLVLQRVCALDLARAHSTYASRTVIEHIGCHIVTLEPGKTYRVFGPRSMAASLWHALNTAAISIG